MLESNRGALFRWQLLGKEYIVVSIDRAIDHLLRSSRFEMNIPVFKHFFGRKQKDKKKRKAIFIIIINKLLKQRKIEWKLQKKNVTQIYLKIKAAHIFFPSLITRRPS